MRIVSRDCALCWFFCCLKLTKQHSERRLLGASTCRLQILSLLFVGHCCTVMTRVGAGPVR